MKKYALWIIALVIIVFGVIWLSSERAVAPGVDVATIAQQVVDGDAVLLDVRTEAELASDGYALNSTHFDLARLTAGELPDVERGVKIYTYCKGGVRAAEAEKILEAAGFTDVTSIGGLADWETSGGVIVRE